MRMLLLAGGIVLQCGIVAGPVEDFIFDYIGTAQQCIGNQVLLLKGIQHGQCLPMKAGAEPARQLLDGADPFAGGDCITDPVNTAV